MLPAAIAMINAFCAAVNPTCFAVSAVVCFAASISTAEDTAGADPVEEAVPAVFKEDKITIRKLCAAAAEQILVRNIQNRKGTSGIQ